jgi:hypothetical protein
MILDRCPWYVAGPIMGLLVVGLRAVLNRGFGAAAGVRLLRAAGAKALVTREPIAWRVEPPRRVGSNSNDVSALLPL